MLNNMLTGPHLFVVLLIVVLLFGAPKLPALARSVGQSMRIFKQEIGGGAAATTDDDSAERGK